MKAVRHAVSFDERARVAQWCASGIAQVEAGVGLRHEPHGTRALVLRLGKRLLYPRDIRGIARGVLGRIGRDGFEITVIDVAGRPTRQVAPSPIVYLKFLSLRSAWLAKATPAVTNAATNPAIPARTTCESCARPELGMKAGPCGHGTRLQRGWRVDCVRNVNKRPTHLDGRHRGDRRQRPTTSRAN